MKNGEGIVVNRWDWRLRLAS